MTFLWDSTTLTWTVYCDHDDEHLVEARVPHLEACQRVADAGCPDCSERIAEGRSGIPREYNEC